MKKRLRSSKKPKKNKTVARKKLQAEQQLGFADKLSRLFYSWMKKRPSTPIRNLKAGNYEIKSYVCAGAFGQVRTATHIHTNVIFAAKLEDMKTVRPQLATEYKIYEILGWDVPGFPKIYYFGPCEKLYNVLIMELLGPDLEDLFYVCNNKFSHKTVLNIAMQILLLLKHIHSKNIIYRDIKAENFCIGHHFQNKQHIIYVIDFGLAKIRGELPRKSSAGRCHYMVGTARYMSMNAHFALELSKRDDLQSFGYLLAYFLQGNLPWMGISNDDTSTKDMFENIADEKKNCTVEQFISDGYPEFIEYMNYVLKLSYNEEPDYQYLYDLFKQSYDVHGYEYDNKFDWTDFMNKRFLAQSIDIDPDD